jgi:hypothetical protein
MKISFPKYGPGELLIRKQGATRIISFVAIAVFAGVCGSYLLGNKWWLLTIAVLGIAGVLLFLGVAVVIFLNQSEVNKAPSAPIEENVPRLVPQWDYRAKKPIRAHAAADIPSAQISEVLSSDSFGINDNVWCNDDSPECTTHTFISHPPEAEEPVTKALPQTTDTVCTAATADDAAVSGYDQSLIDEQTASLNDGCRLKA